jgi:hypothetical protein
VQENSGVVVRACTTAPAAKMRSAIGAVSRAISSTASEPYRMRQPSTGTSSLSATGSPSSGRMSSPRAYRSADSAAAMSAASSRTSVNAFTVGSTSTARACTDASNSTGERSLARIRASASVALNSQTSVTR